MLRKRKKNNKIQKGEYVIHGYGGLEIEDGYLSSLWIMVKQLYIKIPFWSANEANRKKY